MRDSPRRLRCFERLQQTDANALRPYCPTRWVLRESALTSVMHNYSELWEFMNEVSEIEKSEAGAKAAGFANQLSKFQTYFTLASLLQLFTAIGTVNQALQAASLDPCAVEFRRRTTSNLFGAAAVGNLSSRRRISSAPPPPYIFQRF